MIRYVSGDVLNSKAAAIAHGVAPNDSFNQGLAHSLREAWPAMYKDFRHYCQSAHPKAGECWTWSGAEGARQGPEARFGEALHPVRQPAHPRLRGAADGVVIGEKLERELQHQFPGPRRPPASALPTR